MRTIAFLSKLNGMRNAVFFTFWLGFHFLFWKQQLGVNVILFGLLLQAYAKFDSQSGLHIKQEWPYLFGLLSSGFGLIIYHSIIAQFAWLIVNLTYLSFHYRPKLSPFEHGVNAVLRPFQFQQPVFAAPLLKSPASFKKLISYFSLAFVPILLIIVFTALFREGNPVFKEWSQAFVDWIIRHLPDYDLAWLFFMFLGLMVLRIAFLQEKEFYWLLDPNNFLTRKVHRLKRFFKPLALKREYRLGLMVFVSLNALILLVNIIDIQSFWFGFAMPQGFSLKEFLHEGVWALFVSILLAIGLSFYFLRGNLNFYPKNRFFLAMAQLWVLQNCILGISVFLRSFYYIDFHGLANGRLLVLAFLSVVLFVLVLLFIKIRTARNAAFTVRWTSLYIGLLFGMASLVNWDAWVLKYNLDHGRINEIDVDNYLYMNPRVYPQLVEHFDRVEQQIEAHKGNQEVWISVTSLGDFQERLQKRMERYLEKQSAFDWPSWTYADQKALEFIESQ